MSAFIYEIVTSDAFINENVTLDSQNNLYHKKLSQSTWGEK